MKTFQIGGMSIPKEERGPFVNVAFTLDMQALEMLQNQGKNRSQTVRRAIKHYCREIEPEPALVEKFREVVMERNELREVVEIQKKIINSQGGKVDFQPGINVSSRKPGKFRLIISRILERCRNLFNKHGE